jgi:hypothetical protein
MPLYQITGPDGNLYEIEGPEGATRQQVIAAVQKRMASQEEAGVESRLQQLRAEREELLKPKPTVGGNIKEFGKGLVPGAINLLESAGTVSAHCCPTIPRRPHARKSKSLLVLPRSHLKLALGMKTQ